MKKVGFIVLIAMIVGCFNAFGGVTKPAKVEGVVIRHIGAFDEINPTADFNHAWVYNKDNPGLFIIDVEGNIINKDKPFFKNEIICGVYPTKKKNSAWVITIPPDPSDPNLRDGKQGTLYWLESFKEECEPIKIISPFTIRHLDNTLAPIKSAPCKTWGSMYKGDEAKLVLLNREKMIKDWNLPYDDPTVYISACSTYSIHWILKEKKTGKNIVSTTKLLRFNADGTSTSYTLPNYPKSNWIIHTLKYQNALDKDILWLMNIDESSTSTNATIRLFSYQNDNPLTAISEFQVNNGKYYYLNPINDKQAWFYFNTHNFDSFLKFIDATVKPAIIHPLLTPIHSLQFIHPDTCLWYTDKSEGFKSLTFKNGSLTTTTLNLEGVLSGAGLEILVDKGNINQYSDGQYFWLCAKTYKKNELNKVFLLRLLKDNIFPVPISTKMYFDKIQFDCRGENAWMTASIDTDPAKDKYKGKRHLFHLAYVGIPNSTDCNIRFGDQHIDSSKNQWTLTLNGELNEPEAKTAIHLPEGKNKVLENGSFIMDVTNHKGNTIKGKTLQDGSIVHFDDGKPFNAPGLYTVKLNYFNTDEGSNVTYTWDNIRVERHWLKTPWIRTSILAVFIILIGILSLWSPILKMSKKFRGWLFIGLLSMFGPAGTTFAKEKFFNQYHLDPTLLNIILITFVVVLMLSGALNSKLFRKLAQIQPFSFLSHPALLLRHVRKRFYRDYYNKLYHRLKAEQKNANMECYCPLPATINSEIATLENPLENRQIDDPPSYLFNYLMKPRGNQRPVFLIEGIGGTGKSALARKTLHLFLKQFDKKAKGPIPIYISDASKYKTITEAIEKELGDHAISTEHLNQKIERGEFVIIIDNLHEKKIPINEINNYLNTIYSNPSPLIGISRYHKDVHGIFEKYPNTTFIHPLPLTNETLDGFVEKYKPGYQLPPAVISACASPDNTFNPLLIRLALLSNSIKATKITDIYDNAIKSLLKTASDSGGEDHSKKLRKGAMKLCMDSYWETGERTITVKEDNLDLIKELIGAGLLVSADERSDNKSVNNERSPRWVRFFHDTMQSYLTARALNDTGNWDALAEAAGAPRFSDDLTDTDDKSGTELFLMCLETFGPDETRINHLTQIMNTWAKNEKLNLTISKSVILDALPKSLHQKVIQESKDQSIGKTLETAINICKQKNDDINRFFGRLAPKIYSIVYEKEEKKKRSDEVTE